MQYILLMSGLCSFVVLYLLTQATDSNSLLAPYFWVLVGISGALALLMFGITGRYIWRIIQDKQNRVFGSQIARRLSFMFTLVAVLPALFLLSVSAQFISHSINSWFGNDTKQALERSLKLSQNALEASAQHSYQNAQVIVTHATIKAMQQEDFSLIWQMPQGKEFEQLAIWDFDLLKPVQTHNHNMLPEPQLDKETVLQLRQNNMTYHTENINHALYTTGWIKLPDRYNGKRYVLFFRQRVPQNIADDAQLIEAARAKYAELMFAKSGLQQFFLITLGVATGLAILIALTAALSFARRFVEPILALAEGAKAVAQGDFSRQIAANEKDELGKLAGLFNHMTEQLAIAQQTDKQHRIEQEAARHYLERVLASLSTAVITLDNSGCLKTYNPVAIQLLDIDLSELLSKQAKDWAHLSPQHALSAQVLNTLIDAENQEQPVEIGYLARDESRILLGKAVRLPAENGNGWVLVLDNITALVRAQKEAAWGEVAKRLAHEIRNPLTPIQLSAERLAWKLHDKLDASDAQILTKATTTIVKQVAALKEMVEAFRNYARAPRLHLMKIDLNELIEEVLVLYESSACTFIVNLSKMPIILQADITAMRQVLHNLFKNAAEAAQYDKHAKIWVQTYIDEQKKQYLLLQNNGLEFSEHMLQHAFEPYVTNKPTGTGLGLAVVKKIIEDHGGCIKLSNQEPIGATVTITFIPIEK